MNTLLAACPICAHTNLETYVEGMNKTVAPHMIGSSRTEASTGRIVRCLKCRFGFRELRPSDAKLTQLYQEMDTRLYNAEFRGRAQTAEAHLSIVQHYLRQAGRLLDVGCASGLFLRRAMETGWEVAGVELSEMLCTKAREVLGPRAEIHCATLESVPFRALSFDAITLWDVLEHVRDPIPFLKLCASLLKPDGYLFMNVPNLDSIQSRFLRSRWPLLLPEHLNYFTPSSLRMCGDKASLQSVAFFRRPVSFSLDYVLYRLGQHRIRGTSLVRTLVRSVGLQDYLIQIHLGEICSVWRI